MICLPVLILVFIEIILRLAGYGEDYKLFIDFPGKEIQKHRIVNPEMGKKYFQKLEYTKPCHDMFLGKKPKNGFRIFVLGSSTVIGFPYEENLIFTRILQQRLQDCYPEKKIEIVNTAITAINSFTLRDYISQILKEDPDAIMIYAGHNEFYGALGIGSVEKINSCRGLVLLHLDLLSFKTYQLLRNLITGVGKLIQGKKGEIHDSGTLMKMIAGNREIGYQTKTYQRGIDSYRKNMGDILRKAKKKKVPVFISELVSNIKDLPPFCSSQSPENEGAGSVYLQAVEDEKMGNFIDARKNYLYAKDLDCIRFRASENINETIRELAKQYDATLVETKTLFEGASPHNLTGNNLLTEHVHPNIDGYFLMADAFFRAITRSKIIGEKLDPVYYKSSAYYQKNWGYTEIDSLLGVHRVNSLKNHWPFLPLDAPFTDYRKIYKPVSLIDSMAFEVLKSENIHMNEIHQQMAGYYQQKGDFYNAYREFHAAIACNPYQIKDYLEAANCLIKINDLSGALALLEKSLDIQKTFFAYFKIGETLILKGEYKEAVQKFHQAAELDVRNENHQYILLKLHQAYSFDKNTVKADETLAELMNLYPGIKTLSTAKNKEFMYFLPQQVETIVLEGIHLFLTGKYEAAWEVFNKSVAIKETALANKYIGDILHHKQDSSAIIYYRKAYPDCRKNPEFLYNFCVIYLQNHLPDKAIEILKEIKTIDPGYSKISLLEELIQIETK